MKMGTKRIIAAFIMVVVFAGLIVCPALARKYDTMMVGPDRWIDTSSNTINCPQPNEIAQYAEYNEDANNIAFFQIDEPNVITYDGQLEPNAIVLIYYPDEEPEHPNDITIEGNLEPNLAVLFRQPSEHPERPNTIAFENIEPNLVLISLQSEHPVEPNDIYVDEDTEPNLLLISLQAEHPEEPNTISVEEEIDPNDVKKIILDEGTATRKGKKPEIAKSY
jgi:hypothetical protein